MTTGITSSSLSHGPTQVAYLLAGKKDVQYRTVQQRTAKGQDSAEHHWTEDPSRVKTMASNVVVTLDGIYSTVENIHPGKLTNSLSGTQGLQGHGVCRVNIGALGLKEGECTSG